MHAESAVEQSDLRVSYDEPSDRGRVHVYADDLAKALAVMGEQLSRIENRLRPVLSEQEHDGEQAIGRALPSDTSPLAQVIAESASQVDAMALRLGALTDRLEV